MIKQGLHVVLGTGPLGLAVVDELLKHGAAVRVVNRSGKAVVPDGVSVDVADLSNPNEARRVCTGASVVYHCVKPPYTDWPKQFPPIMDAVIAACEDSHAVLVYGDNLYMYGPVAGPMTEDLPYAAPGHKGRTRAGMAEQLLDAHRQGRIRAVIGQASDFFGPRVLDSTLGSRVFPNALSGKPSSLLGNLDVPHTFTYIRDYAAALVNLGSRDDTWGQNWHVPSAETLTTREMLTKIYAAAGTRMRASVLPKPLVRIIGLFHPTLRELNEMMYSVDQPYVVCHDKYVSKFGNHATPHEDAIRETLAWYEAVALGS